MDYERYPHVWFSDPGDTFETAFDGLQLAIDEALLMSGKPTRDLAVALLIHSQDMRSEAAEMKRLGDREKRSRTMDAEGTGYAPGTPADVLYATTEQSREDTKRVAESFRVAKDEFNEVLRAWMTSSREGLGLPD